MQRRAGRQGVLPPDVPLIERRAVALSVVCGCVALFLLLGIYHATSARLAWFDREIEAWSYDHLTRPRLQLAHDLADLGGLLPTFLVTIGLVVWAAAHRSWRGALLAALSPLVAVPLTEYVFKPLFGHTLRGSLPDATTFPSGHTTAAFAGIAVASLFLLRRPGPSGRAVSRSAAASLIAAMSLGGLLVMVGLIGSQYHLASDTVGGVCVSLASVMSLAFAIDAAGRRLERPREHPGQPVVTAPVSTTSNAEPGTVLS